MDDKTREGKWKVKELSRPRGPVLNTRRGYLFYSWWLKWKTRPSARHCGAGETLTFRSEAVLCNAWLSLLDEILLFPHHYCKTRRTQVIKTKHFPPHESAPTHYGDKSNLHIWCHVFPAWGSQHVASFWRRVERRSKLRSCTEANRTRNTFENHSITVHLRILSWLPICLLQPIITGAGWPSAPRSYVCFPFAQ